MVLDNYMHIQLSFLTIDEVNSIHEFANRQNEINATVGNEDNHGQDDRIRRSQVKWLEPSELPNNLIDKINQGIETAHQESNWNWELLHQQTIQYTIYHAKGEHNQTDSGFYTWHQDAGPPSIPYTENGEKMIRKTSWVVQLSHPDQYEGGGFQWIEPTPIFDRLPQHNISNVDITNAIRTIPFSGKEVGSLLVFPSFLHHQVPHITRGTRVSLVGWVCGRDYV